MRADQRRTQSCRIAFGIIYNTRNNDTFWRERERESATNISEMATFKDHADTKLLYDHVKAAHQFQQIVE